jgi:hypothetical protein
MRGFHPLNRSSILLGITISLCSSRNRASSVEDEDVGVKPTGGSSYYMPLLAQLVRALDCGSGGFGSIPKFGTMTNARMGLHFFMQKTDVVRFHFRAGARQKNSINFSRQSECTSAARLRALEARNPGSSPGTLTKIYWDTLSR